MRKEKIKEYMEDNGWGGKSQALKSKNMQDIKKRIEKMYLKEIEHIESMNRKLKKLKKPYISKIFNKRINTEKDFEYKTEEELISLAINKVNSCFNKIIKQDSK